MNDLQIARGGGETEGNGLSQRGTWRLLTGDSGCAFSGAWSPLFNSAPTSAAASGASVCRN